MLLQYWVTFTYFAYICSSRGKLWTFLSSLAWKVPNLIHLFVGYLERKQWSQVMKCRNFLFTGIYRSFSQCLSRAGIHFVLSSCKAAAKFPTQNLSRSLTMTAVCKPLKHKIPGLSNHWNSASLEWSPPDEHNSWQVAWLWAGSRKLSRARMHTRTSVQSLTPPALGIPEIKEFSWCPWNACSLQKAVGAQQCLNHPKATL